MWLEVFPAQETDAVQQVGRELTTHTHCALFTQEQ